MAVDLPEGPSYPGHSPLHKPIFLPCSPLNDCRRAARSLLKIGLLSSLFFLSLARLHILLLQDFWISVLRSDRTHSRSEIFSTDATHASSGIIIFVKQDLSFSELSTSSLSSPDPYSDYVGVNISPNDSSSLSFPSAYAPPIRSHS